MQPAGTNLPPEDPGLRQAFYGQLAKNPGANPAPPDATPDEPKQPTISGEDLAAALGGTETASGALAVEQAAGARVVPESPLAVQVGRWGRRRGTELAERWQDAGFEIDEHVAADMHATLFEVEPQLTERCTDKLRSQWVERLLETPEFQRVRRTTMLDTSLSAVASKGVADQWVQYQEEYEKQHPDGDCPGDGNGNLGDEISQAASAAEAAKQAGEDVNDMQNCMAGLGIGDDSDYDYRRTLELFELVRGNHDLRRLFDLAGRLRLMCSALQSTKLVHGRDDMVGIELGGKIEDLLPTEKLKLGCGVEEAELEAMDRFLRKKMLSKHYRAEQKVGKGPIVVCVDESGSMMGEQIALAKALALTLAWLAKKQKRWCCLNGFQHGDVSSSIVLQPGKWNDEDVLRWLTHFFCGGTSLDVPFGEVPKRWPTYLSQGMARGHADHIVITDGQVNCDNDLLRNYKEWAKKEDVTTYGLFVNCSPCGSLPHACQGTWSINESEIKQEGIENVLSI